MKGSKFTCGTMKAFSRTLKLEVRSLLTIFVIAVFACSVQVSVFHHNNGIMVERDCPICKFLAVFPSGSEAAVQTITAPDFVRLIFAPENLLISFALLATVLGNRAPPYLFFSDKT